MNMAAIISSIARASKPEPEYQYRLDCIHYTSKDFGPCDVCGGRVDAVWRQVEDVRRVIDGKAHYIPGETKFGHEDCLVKVRRVK
jgi:hypothetical protein